MEMTCWVLSSGKGSGARALVPFIYLANAVAGPEKA